MRLSVRRNNLTYRALERAREQARQQTPEFKAWDKSPERRAYQRAYKRSPKGRAYYRALSHKYNSRVRANGGSWTSEQFEALCRHFNNRCVCCGRKGKMTADHVIPVAVSQTLMLPLGFLNDIDNIQPLLKECNSRKKTKTIDYRVRPHPMCLHGRKSTDPAIESAGPVAESAVYNEAATELRCSP